MYVHKAIQYRNQVLQNHHWEGCPTTPPFTAHNERWTVIFTGSYTVAKISAIYWTAEIEPHYNDYGYVIHIITITNLCTFVLHVASILGSNQSCYRCYRRRGMGDGTRVHVV